MDSKSLSQQVGQLKKIVFDNEITDWKALDALLKQLKLKRANKTAEPTPENRLYEGYLASKALFSKVLDGLKLEGLEGDAQELVDSVRERFEKTLPSVIERWLSSSGETKKVDMDLMELINIDLELPYINATTVGSHSESWCDTLKTLRKELLSLIAFVQSVIYRVIAWRARTIESIEPFWPVILERAAVESDDDDDDDDDEEEEEGEGEEEANEDEEDDSDDESDTAAPASGDEVPQTMEEEDELVDIADPEAFVKLLAMTDEEERNIAEKKANLERLKSLKVQTDEELESLHGRRMRLAKVIEAVLGRVKVEEYVKGKPLNEVIALFKSLCAPCYNLYGEMVHHMKSEAARDIAWVKRLKELLNICNTICRKMVTCIVSEVRSHRKLAEESPKKKQRKSSDDKTLAQLAIVCYAMCHQSLLDFYVERARIVADDGWKQLLITLQWTGALCDELWRVKYHQKEAAAVVKGQMDADGENDDVEDADANDEAENLWWCKLFDYITVHPPSINCKLCRGKHVLEQKRCMNMKKHADALFVKIVIDGLSLHKNNSPFRMFKAAKELELQAPSMLLAHCLKEMANARPLCKELLGLAL